MSIFTKALIATSLFVATNVTMAGATPAYFDANATHLECFVPNGYSCQSLLLDQINSAQQQILVQAIDFTDINIANALVKAYKRGVDVKVIIDKEQLNNKYSVIRTVINGNVPVVTDVIVQQAHNKIMIFDNNAVFTGSFNFTVAASKNNAENGSLITNDSNFTASYVANWNTRYQKSYKIQK